MMTKEMLLKNIRNLNRMLQRAGIMKPVYDDLSAMSGDMLDASVLMVSKEGMIVCLHRNMTHKGSSFQQLAVEETLDDTCISALNRVLDTWESAKAEKFGFSKGEGEQFAVVLPMESGAERIGTLIYQREGEDFDVMEVAVMEFAAAIICANYAQVIIANKEKQRQQAEICRGALASLSYSELEASISIFEQLGGKEGMLVASKIADSRGITRSVIVNALRKFESAGIIESRSLGMKGTYIKIINSALLDEMAKYIER